MEKLDAKRYRRKLLVRHAFMTLLWLLMLGILIYRIANEGSEYPGKNSSNWLFYILHMIILSSSSCPKIKIFKALRDDAELRRAWNAEHDERLLTINARAGIPLMPNTAIVLACVGMLVSLWRWDAGWGITLAALVVNAVSLSAYSYWDKRLTHDSVEEAEEP